MSLPTEWIKYAPKPRRLTGEDLGSDRERWKRWQRSQQRPVAVGPPE